MVTQQIPQNGVVQEFLREMKPFCVGEPTFTKVDVSVILKSDVLKDKAKYDEIRSKAQRDYHATVTVMPHAGFRLLFSGSVVAKEKVLVHLHAADFEGGGPQPRTKIEPNDPETVRLFDNIRLNGQLEPIHVYPSPITPNKYRIYDGHTSHMIIFTMLMKHEILAIIDFITEEEAYKRAFILNNDGSRRNLNSFDQGHYITEVLMKRYPNDYHTQEDIGKHLGLSQDSISLILRAYAEIGAQKGNLSPEKYEQFVKMPLSSAALITRAPEPTKTAIINTAIEKDLSREKVKELVKEVKAVPDADEKTVEEKAKALFEETDRELRKTDRSIEKLVEGALVLAPEALVREAVGRFGEAKATQEKLNNKLATVFSVFFDRAKSKPGELDTVFDEAAKWGI